MNIDSVGTGSPNEKEIRKLFFLYEVYIHLYRGRKTMPYSSTLEESL